MYYTVTINELSNHINYNNNKNTTTTKTQLQQKHNNNNKTQLQQYHNYVYVCFVYWVPKLRYYSRPKHLNVVKYSRINN